jgi:hypothetical protein
MNHNPIMIYRALLGASTRRAEAGRMAAAAEGAVPRGRTALNLAAQCVRSAKFSI